MVEGPVIRSLSRERRSAHLVASAVVVGSAAGPHQAQPRPPAAGGEVVWEVPPVGNTGGKVTSQGGVWLWLGVDWLNVTLPAEHLGNVLRGLREMFGEGERRPYGRHTYQRMVEYRFGAFVCWSEGRPELLVSFNGDSLQGGGTKDWRVLFQWLRGMGAVGTRVDLKVDDMSRQLLRMEDVHAAAESEDFCGFRYEDGGRRPKKNGRLVGDGRTFGKRGKEGGGVQVQCYDKGLESKGGINGNRLEARFSKKKAALVFSTLAAAACDEDFEQLIRGFIGGSIDFRSRGRHQHKQRMERLSWWQRLLDRLGAATVQVLRRRACLEEWASHARAAVLASLAVVRSEIQRQGMDFYLVLQRALDLALDQKSQGWVDRRSAGVDVEACIANLLGPEVPA